MRSSRIFGIVILASVAMMVAPAAGVAQSTADKMEQMAKRAMQDAKTGMQDAKTGMTDSWLTAKTKIALFADERIKGGQISVETVKGAVSLRGKVDSEEAKAAAGSVTKSVEGVKSVRNDLEVVSPGDRKMVDTSDKDITRQVEGRLSNDAQFRKVDVRTDGGAVILTGAVSSIGASARASELARGVPGVRMVKNELAYGGTHVTRGSTGRSHAQVGAMQQALKDKGFDPGATDGVMGPKTTEALKAYQKSENLPTTGTMDGDTGAKLGVKVSTEGR
jgi:hyperosmotically inducible periplasmic protein